MFHRLNTFKKFGMAENQEGIQINDNNVKTGKFRRRFASIDKERHKPVSNKGGHFPREKSNKDRTIFQEGRELLSY
jgi:hypothetical protein